MTEYQLHCAVADYLRIAMPLHIPWTHFPAGEKRDARTGAKLKRLGLQPGWPDFIIATNPVIFIELKVGKGRLSGSQAVFATRAVALGHKFVIARSLGDVEETLKAYSVPIRAKVTA